MQSGETKAVMCPSCGANGDFKEDIPNRYRCSFCFTVFEHSTVVPVKSTERILYEYFQGLYFNLQELDSQDEDYWASAFGIVVQMENTVPQLAGTSNTLKIAGQWEESLSKVIDTLHSQNIKETLSLEEAIELSVIAELTVLTKCYQMKASNLLSKGKKDEALIYCDKAIQMTSTYFDETNNDLESLKEDILVLKS